MPEAPDPIVINPYAILKSLEDQYTWYTASGVADPAVYQGLQAQADRWVTRWTTETESEGNDPAIMKNLVDQGRDLSRRLAGAVDNAGLIQYGRSRDQYVSAAGDPNALPRELYDLIKNQGVPIKDAVKIMMQSGEYSLAAVQAVAFKVGDPKFDPSAAAKDAAARGETPLPFGPGGGGGFKPYEQIAHDVTNPQDEFQKGFAQFTRQLETVHAAGGVGKAPELSALSANYQSLFNKYLGEIEARKARGEEPANVFKEAYVNIGKSTDPQFNQETDRLQLQTVRPSISVFDWLTKNVDPEDVLASTPQDRRPGRSTGGFRGYVRRLGG